MLTTSLKVLLALVVGLAFRPAQAQNNPVAAAQAKARFTPAINLSAVPTPEEDARFYDDTHKDLGPALVWMQEANAAQPTYWNLYTEARIHLRMNNYPAALATAARARKLAQNACDDTYARLSGEVMKLASPAPASHANPPVANALASAE